MTWTRKRGPAADGAAPITSGEQTTLSRDLTAQSCRAPSHWGEAYDLLVDGLRGDRDCLRLVPRAARHALTETVTIATGKLVSWRGLTVQAEAVTPDDLAAEVDGATLSCPDCGSVVPALRWHTWPGGVADLAADCPVCGRWLRWISQVEPWLSLVEQQQECGGAA